MADLPFPDDPTLRAAAAGVRHDWRMEGEATARDAYAVWRHARTMHDALRECMARGDRVEVRMHGHRFEGVIVDLAADLVSVRDANRPRVDVHLGALGGTASGAPLLVRVLEPAYAPGRTGGGFDGDFRGRLHAREANDEPVRVFVAGERDPLLGRVTPARDALVVTSAEGGETWCALSAVVAIATAPGV